MYCPVVFRKIVRGFFWSEHLRKVHEGLLGVCLARVGSGALPQHEPIDWNLEVFSGHVRFEQRIL